MSAQRFFRYVWRIDAILILVAAGIAVFGLAGLLVEEFSIRTANRHDAQTGVQVAADPPAGLILGHAESVSGSSVLRADLSVRGGEGKFSSGGYSETRNILFIDPDQKNARWLLPDNQHVIGQRSDIKDDLGEAKEKLLATAALIEAESSQTAPSTNRLVLFDASGKNLVEVASEVSDLQLATLSGKEIVLLYERNRHLVRSTFDASSLVKRSEQQIEVPQLK